MDWHVVRTALAQLKALTREQRNAFLAAFLGWTLDAFDFFLMVFVLKDIAATFHVDKSRVAMALTLTLAFRPLGALLFGVAGDRFGRRIPLMVDVIFYATMELLSGFAPTLTIFLILRALFGIAMGGEWGLGSALAMETIPAESRGLLSGILQEGYVCGYLLAAVVYRIVSGFHVSWRFMFFVGVLPALLSLFIRAHVKESPAWRPPGQRLPDDRAGLPPAPTLIEAVQKNAGLFVYLVLLMAAFNFMSHGSQDLYPTFLQTQRKFSSDVVSDIAIIYNIGALFGGIFFGAISQTIGRRKAIICAAALAIPIVPLWAFSHGAALLALGAFVLQFMLQGAWGVVPAHLSELAPSALRGTFTGFAYQLGNLIASSNAIFQAGYAEREHGDYATGLAITVAVAAVAVMCITALGRESREVRLDGSEHDVAV